MADKREAMKKKIRTWQKEEKSDTVGERGDACGKGVGLYPTELVSPQESHQVPQ